ncbi:AAA family ATPase [Rhodoferax sp.]
MVTGPRQVGKTTLLEMCAKEGTPVKRAYVTLLVQRAEFCY